MSRDWNELISAYLDGELDPEERREFDARLASGEISARELEEMRAMRNLTATAKPTEFPDPVWDRYWDQTYNRIERNIGWILLSAGGAVLIGYGLYAAILALFRENDLAWWIRLAIAITAAGFGLLFISVLRERLHVRRSDPYREVKR